MAECGSVDMFFSSAALLAERFIREVPKCELHIHLEGALPANFQSADRNRNSNNNRTATEADGDNEKEKDDCRQTGRSSSSFYSFDPSLDTVPADTATATTTTTSFTCLKEFLELYYERMSLLRTEDDFFRLTFDYLRTASRENVKHADCFFDPQVHCRRGVDFATVIRGMRKAQKRAQKEMHITSNLIMCFLRDEPLQSALDVIEMARPYSDWIEGVGLDSNERGYPCKLFAKAFDVARDIGWKAVAHAGEDGPPSHIWEALDVLKVERIDHGTCCVEDPALVERLVKDCVPLTVCPLSSVKLGRVASLETHPLLRSESLLRGAGGRRTTHDLRDGHQNTAAVAAVGQEIGSVFNISISSDDPAYFGGSVNDNLLACSRTKSLGWDMSVVKQLAENSVTAAFIDSARKQTLLDEIDQCYARLNKLGS